MGFFGKKNEFLKIGLKIGLKNANKFLPTTKLKKNQT